MEEERLRQAGLNVVQSPDRMAARTKTASPSSLDATLPSSSTTSPKVSTNDNIEAHTSEPVTQTPAVDLAATRRSPTEPTTDDDAVSFEVQTMSPTEEQELLQQQRGKQEDVSSTDHPIPSGSALGTRQHLVNVPKPGALSDINGDIVNFEEVPLDLKEGETDDVIPGTPMDVDEEDDAENEDNWLLEEDDASDEKEEDEKPLVVDDDDAADDDEEEEVPAADDADLNVTRRKPTLTVKPVIVETDTGPSQTLTPVKDSASGSTMQFNFTTPPPAVVQSDPTTVDELRDYVEKHVGHRTLMKFYRFSRKDSIERAAKRAMEAATGSSSMTDDKRQYVCIEV